MKNGQKKDWTSVFVMFSFILGLGLLAGSGLGKHRVLLLIAGICVGTMVLFTVLLINGKIKSQFSVFCWLTLFILPLYLAHFIAMPINGKITVLDGKIMEGFSWKVPFISKVIEVDKNVFARYNCFAVQEDSSVQGYYWVNCQVKVQDKVKFLEFVANEKNPNEKISKAANKFLKILVVDAGLFKENPRKNMEEFHDH